MEYSISCDDDARLIRNSTHGDANAADTEKMVTELVSVVNDVGCEKVLIDSRQSILKDDMLDSYNFMSNLDELNVPRNLKVAVVIMHNREQHSFSEDVAFNRGWSGIKYFTDLNSAEKWL